MLPKAFGVRMQRSATDTTEYVKHLAFANDTLPTGDRALSASTVEHDQAAMEIAIYEQGGTVASEDLAANNPVTKGVGVIKVPPQPPGQFASVEIVMAIDANGLLQLRATEQSTGEKLLIEVTVGMTEAEVAEAVRTSAMITVSS